MDEQAIIDTFAALRKRIAETAGISEQRIVISHRVFSAEDGGAAWLIDISRPAKRKGSRDDKLDSYGNTLAEAETQLMERIALHWEGK